MLKKIFISSVLLLAVLSFVISLLKGNNNGEKIITQSDRVAVININGTIISGAGSDDNLLGGTEGTVSGDIMAQIREAASDSSVKALLLRIDSGGGSATAAEEIGAELKRFKKTKKPIVSVMGDSGASAAYWIAACASDKIYANNTTITGSIGVYISHMNTSELLKKIGVDQNKIKSGPYKDIMTSERPMSAEEKLIIQNVVNEIYDEFINVVAEGRKMDAGKVRSIADGRFYTGRQAKNLGLIDEIGTYYDALAAAGEMGGVITGEDGLPPVKVKEKHQPWNYFLGAEIAKTVRGKLLEQLGAELQDSSASVNGVR
ncbi:MAG: signal peptide peptidase SppA [Acidaminococcaceae bacterium]|nr:signal peptide peptidase SppA [Acidaminococcaceae bacterium]